LFYYVFSVQILSFLSIDVAVGKSQVVKFVSYVSGLKIVAEENWKKY